MQANYWMGQLHCGAPNQNFGWAATTRPTMQHPRAQTMFVCVCVCVCVCVRVCVCVLG